MRRRVEDIQEQRPSKRRRFALLSGWGEDKDCQAKTTAMECQEDPGGKNNLGQSCGDSREEIDSADASATPEEEYCKDEGHPPPQYRDDCHP